jgi:hypothetical protein
MTTTKNDNTPSTDTEVLKGIEAGLSRGEIEVFVPGVTGHDYEGDLDAMDAELERLAARDAEIAERGPVPFEALRFRDRIYSALCRQRERYAFAGGLRCTTPGCSNHDFNGGVCYECRNGKTPATW